jgi:hypothetical protein
MSVITTTIIIKQSYIKKKNIKPNSFKVKQFNDIFDITCPSIIESMSGSKLHSFKSLLTFSLFLHFLIFLLVLKIIYTH